MLDKTNPFNKTFNKLGDIAIEITHMNIGNDEKFILLDRLKELNSLIASDFAEHGRLVQDIFRGVK